MSKLSLFTLIVCIYHTYNEICIMHRKILCQLSYDTPDLISTIFFICRQYAHASKQKQKQERMNKSILHLHVGGIKDWRPSNEKAGPTYIALSAVITATCRFCCRLLLSILLVEYIWSKESIMVKICSIALSFALVGTAFSFTLHKIYWFLAFYVLSKTLLIIIL